MHTHAPPYRALLDDAYRTGETDGALARHLHLPERPPTVGDRFHGRDASQFAEWLWHPRPGAPPSGLIANAGLWYLAGFRDGFRGGRTGPVLEDGGAVATAGGQERPNTARASAPDVCAVSDAYSPAPPPVPRPRAAAPSHRDERIGARG